CTRGQSCIGSGCYGFDYW
nr:immunoglobulin heavy chain junction region [Macaca mulatta]